jgi:uncharacterized membrane protein
MKLGPTSILVIEFTGGEYKGEILAALVELVQAGTVRVIDAVAVKKDGDGKITSLEINQLGVKDVHVFDPLQAEITGLLSNQDINDIGALLDNNSAAGVLVLEQLWANKLAQAIVNAKGKVVLNRLLMPDAVQENLDIIEKIT